MIMKRKPLNFGFTTSLFACLLLATTSFAGSYAKKNSNLVDTAASNNVVHVVEKVTLPTGP